VLRRLCLARAFSLIWLSSQGRSIAVIHATTGIRGVNTRFASRAVSTLASAAIERRASSADCPRH
jgi:hypothetical protein